MQWYLSNVAMKISPNLSSDSAICTAVATELQKLSLQSVRLLQFTGCLTGKVQSCNVIGTAAVLRGSAGVMWPVQQQ
jgi:hypothetical protein